MVTGIFGAILFTGYLDNITIVKEMISSPATFYDMICNSTIYGFVRNNVYLFTAGAVCALILAIVKRGSWLMIKRQSLIYYTAFIVISQILWLKHISKRFPVSEEEDDKRWDRLHTRNARRVQVGIFDK